MIQYYTWSQYHPFKFPGSFWGWSPTCAGVGAVRRRLTAGKLAEALAVDFQHHRRAVVNIWRL